MLKGAYARLPRYFKDADRVMDLETRLLHCMTTLQGRSREEATKRVFGNEDQLSEMDTSRPTSPRSRAARRSRRNRAPEGERAFELGKSALLPSRRRLGHSCASCHGEEGKRIRMQDLPVLFKREFARPIIATWPAYRVSNSQFKTMQWRINDCYRQMRYPGAELRLRHHHRPDHLPHRHRPPASPTAARERSDEASPVFFGSCAFAGRSAGADPADVQKVLQRDFKARGQATMDRVVQDGVQRVCTESDDRPPAELAKQMEADQLKTIAFPGQPDRRLEERRAHRAERPRPAVDRSPPARPAAAAATTATSSRRRKASYGTLGPSLLRFGATRGSGPEMQRYVYGKIYNAKAYNLCSQMPRLGYSGTLTPEQIKDLVGLLLDPASPVNK